jgi:hypothetical protein
VSFYLAPLQIDKHKVVTSSRVGGEPNVKVVAGAVVTVEELVNGSRVVAIVGQDVDVGGILRFRVWGLGIRVLNLDVGGILRFRVWGEYVVFCMPVRRWGLHNLFFLVIVSPRIRS